MKTGSSLRILLVEDNPNDARLIRRLFKRTDSALLPGRVSLQHVETLEAAVEASAEEPPDLLLLDLGLPGSTGKETYERARERLPSAPTVVLTGLTDEETAIELLQAGAQDYLNKDSLNEELLVRTVRYARERWERQRELEQYERIVESMDDVALIVDTDRRLVYGNEYALERSALSVDQLRGMPTMEMAEQLFATQDAVDTYEAALDELFDGDGQIEPYRFEVAVELPDGTEEREYQLSALERGGEVAAVVVIARNITDRKERERELQRTTHAIAKAPVGVTITDPNQEDNPIVYHNEQFREMTGYTAEEILGRNCRFLQGPDTAEESIDEMREGIAEQRPVTVELRNYRKDGTEFWNRVSIAPVTDENGNLLNYVGFQQDVTKRKERQQRLTQQNERLNEFAGVISHDLQNPLTVALGRTTILEGMCGEEALEHVRPIADSLDRMERIIEDTLTLAREGNTVGEKQPVSVTQLVSNCWGQVDTGESTVEVDEEFTILGDENRLKHVFENLFVNAVTHGGEDVVVRIGRAGEDGFYVEDDGSGIPVGDRETVFEAGHSSEQDGTGFGLSIVKRIAEAHGWDVSVTEGSDGGARFEFDDVELLEQD